MTIYAKIGNIESANEVLMRQQERDLVSWNSMLPGYAQCSYGRKSLMIFEEMQKEMDNTTFIGVILPLSMQNHNEGQYILTWWLMTFIFHQQWRSTLSW